MTRSASHFCFVVFPPQSLLDVLESRVMKRTSISYCAMRDFAISAMANSTTQDVRHRAQKPITGPERRKERETFCVRYGKWTRFLRWRTQLHKTTRNASRFSIYIALLDVLESRVMKRTSISYCAMRDFECGYSGSKTLQCEVLGL